MALGKRTVVDTGTRWSRRTVSWREYLGVWGIGVSLTCALAAAVAVTMPLSPADVRVTAVKRIAVSLGRPAIAHVVKDVTHSPTESPPMVALTR